MIKDRVNTIIRDYTEEGFDEDSRLAELGIDSIDVVEVIMDCEKEFSITLDETYEIKTVKDLYTIIGA